MDVEKLFLYPNENAKNHHTEKYELVTDQNIAVVRRAATFSLAIKTNSRAIDLDELDNVNLIFEFGKFRFFHCRLSSKYLFFNYWYNFTILKFILY